MRLSYLLMRPSVRQNERSSLWGRRWCVRLLSVFTAFCMGIAISATPLGRQVDASALDESLTGERVRADVPTNAKRSQLPSEQSEEMLGNRLAGEIESRERVLADPIVDQYLMRITRQLAVAADGPITPHVHVVLDPDVNAYSMPDHIYLNSGLLDAVQNEAELAGAIAHELGHIYTHHSMRAFVRIQRGLPLRRFKCRSELEADGLAVRYTYLAGYDPLAFGRFMERAWSGSSSPGHSIIMPRSFEMYPSLKKRIQHIRVVVARSGSLNGLYPADTSDFRILKLRVLSLVQKGKLCDQNRTKQCAPNPVHPH